MKKQTNMGIMVFSNVQIKIMQFLSMIRVIKINGYTDWVNPISENLSCKVLDVDGFSFIIRALDKFTRSGAFCDDNAKRVIDQVNELINRNSQEIQG